MPGLVWVSLWLTHHDANRLSTHTWRHAFHHNVSWIGKDRLLLAEAVLSLHCVGVFHGVCRAVWEWRGSQHSTTFNGKSEEGSWQVAVVMVYLTGNLSRNPAQRLRAGNDGCSNQTTSQRRRRRWHSRRFETAAGSAEPMTEQLYVVCGGCSVVWWLAHHRATTNSERVPGSIPTWGLSGWIFSCSPHVCVGSPQILCLSPTIQKLACQDNWWL